MKHGKENDSEMKIISGMIQYLYVLNNHRHHPQRNLSSLDLLVGKKEIKRKNQKERHPAEVEDEK